ncbi:MAG: methionyl-tRNA formyltransferase [Candidatus Cloacimonadota bacterium]|nr:MAG: methionyl-tRNA formyltransferase [Candidatus Cloacimonadota bacterium]
MPFVDELEKTISLNHRVTRCCNYEDIPRGDMCFFLSCEKIVPPHILKRNTHNLVVHPSRLPHGRGFSPLAWQILEGKNEIPISLFEAEEKVDSGCVYYCDAIRLKGHELNSEIKKLQGQKTVEMVMRFISNYPHVRGESQQGKGSFYKRRGREDSELDVNKSIAEQFNLLRVVDNERYPAFFCYQGHEYVININKGRK